VHYSNLLLILLIFSYFSVNAQYDKNPTADTSLISKYREKSPVSFIVKTNVFPMIYSKLPLTSEYRLLGEFGVSSKQSICAGASYLGKTIIYNLFFNTSNPGQPLYIRGYRLQFAYRYYLIQRNMAPMGMYVSPHLSYFSADYAVVPFSNNNDFDRLSNFNANILLGLQLIVKNKVAFDFFSGWGYNQYYYNQFVYRNNKMNVISRNPSEFADIINLSNIHFILIGFNFGFVF